MTYRVQIDDEVRDATAEEIARFEAIEAEVIERLKGEAKATARRENALAKLEALGLNEDDLKALGL